MSLAPSIELPADRTRRVLRKVYTRFLLLLIVAYFFSQLERTNLGLAASTFNIDIGISVAAYGLGAGLFFLTYAALEIPSNLLLRRFGARVWIVRIMVTWGILAIAMAFVWNEPSFYVVRLLFGAAEAGFYPGVHYLITRWFPQAERPKAIGILLFGGLFSATLGSPIGGLLLQLDGVGGFQGWQWLFVLEGIPALIIAVLIWRFLADSPSTARWLSKDDGEWLERTIEAENTTSAHSVGLRSFVDVLKDIPILLVTFVYFTVSLITYALTYFLPGIIGTMGTFTPFEIGLINAVPWVFTMIGVFVVPRLAARTHSFLAWLIVSLSGSIAGFAIVLLADGWFAFLGFCLIGLFLLTPSTILFSYAGYRMDGSNLAAGLALVSSIGITGGFVGPYLLGGIQQATGSVDLGLVFVAGFAALALLASVALFVMNRLRPLPSAATDTAP